MALHNISHFLQSTTMKGSNIWHHYLFSKQKNTKSDYLKQLLVSLTVIKDSLKKITVRVVHQMGQNGMGEANM